MGAVEAGAVVISTIVIGPIVVERNGP